MYKLSLRIIIEDSSTCRWWKGPMQMQIQKLVQWQHAKNTQAHPLEFTKNLCATKVSF